MRIDLRGRVALVTGASRGIGRGIAEALSAAGATVAINYRARHDAAKEALAAIEGAGGQAFLVPTDVSDPRQASALVDAVTARTGRLDILVNNAGVTRDGLFTESTDEDWEALMGTNLEAVAACSRRAIPAMMLKGFGRIINVSSVAAARGGRGAASYAASKGGVNALTRALAVELAPRRITVNAIAPGLIETDLSRPLLAAAARRDLVPMRRAGTPADVAPLAVFLASEQAAYLTGQIIAVDGGMG
jgi:3-oxoacyl-[acyl-carrier protein] reductase